jgi:hypothetical protein
VTARGRVAIWTVRYSPEAHDDFQRMSFDVAYSICAEVHAAATGEPAHVRTDPNDPSLIAILAEGGFAVIRLDAHTQTFNVSRLVAEVPIDPAVALLDDPQPPPSSH